MRATLILWSATALSALLGSLVAASGGYGALFASIKPGVQMRVVWVTNYTTGFSGDTVLIRDTRPDPPAQTYPVITNATFTTNVAYWDPLIITNIIIGSNSWLMVTNFYPNVMQATNSYRW